MNENLKSSESFPAIIHTKLWWPLKITLLKLRQSRAIKDSPCDPETPVSIAPHSACSFQKARSSRKSNVLACLGVRKKYYGSSSAMCSICNTQQAAQDLAAIRGETTLCRNMRSEGKDSNKDNLSSIKYPSPRQFQVGRTQMSRYWCTAAAWGANNQHSTHLQWTEHKTREQHSALGNPPAWTHLHLCVISLEKGLLSKNTI